MTKCCWLPSWNLPLPKSDKTAQEEGRNLVFPKKMNQHEEAAVELRMLQSWLSTRLRTVAHETIALMFRRTRPVLLRSVWRDDKTMCPWNHCCSRRLSLEKGTIGRVGDCVRKYFAFKNLWCLCLGSSVRSISLCLQPNDSPSGGRESDSPTCRKYQRCNCWFWSRAQSWLPGSNL